MSKCLLLLLLLVQIISVCAQTTDSLIRKSSQTDLIDIGDNILKKGTPRREEVITNHQGRIHISAFPAAGYTLQTGFAGVLSGNAAFFTNAHNHETENISTIVSSIAYTAKSQIILPIESSTWTKGNKYNIVTDWRFLKYPSETFGLGGNTKQDSGYNLDYAYIKLHQAILRKIGYELYAGLGYDF